MSANLWAHHQQQSSWGGPTPFSSPAITSTKRKLATFHAATTPPQGQGQGQQWPELQQQHPQSPSHLCQPQCKRVDRTQRRSPAQAPPPQASAWFSGAGHQWHQHQHPAQQQQRGTHIDASGEWSMFAQELAECARSVGGPPHHMYPSHQHQHQHHLSWPGAAAAQADNMDMDNGVFDGDEGEELEGTLLLFGAPS